MEPLIELFDNIIEMAQAGRDAVQQAVEQAGGAGAAQEPTPPGDGQAPPQA